MFSTSFYYFATFLLPLSFPSQSLPLDTISDQNEIYGTGCNTDSQLGLGPTSSSLSKDVYSFLPTLLPEIVKERGIEWIRAGADTSALLDKEGDLWTWGNSVSPALVPRPKEVQIFISCRLTTGVCSSFTFKNHTADTRTDFD